MIRAAQVVMFVCAMMFSNFNVAAADIYKWVDAKGVVHYSDRPHNQTAQKVILRKENIADPVSASVIDEMSGPEDDGKEEGGDLEGASTNTPKFTNKQQCAAIEAEMTKMNQVAQTLDANMVELLRKKIKELGC